MFVRIKKVKGKNYAYLVENSWKKRKQKGSRQKVKAYLGRIIKLDKVSEPELLKYLEIESYKELVEKNKDEIILDLVKWELKKHGFIAVNDSLIYGNLIFKLNDKRFYDNENKEKNVVLEINEGFFCRQTLKRLINFKITGTEKEIGLELAKRFLESGLKIPEELFVKLYQKFV